MISRSWGWKGTESGHFPNRIAFAKHLASLAASYLWIPPCNVSKNENCALLTPRTLPLINNRTFFGVSIYPIYSNGILYKWKRHTILKLNFIWSEISWHQVSQGTVIAHIDQFKFTFLICQQPCKNHFYLFGSDKTATKKNFFFFQ